MITEGSLRRIGAGLTLAASAAQAQVPPAPELDRAGRAVIEALRAGDVAVIEARFSEAMRESISHERVVAATRQIHAQFGDLQSCGGPDLRSTGPFIVEYRCRFERAALTLRLVWTVAPTGGFELAGYFLRPLPSAPLPTDVREEAITTGAPGWPLPGTALMPVSAVRPPMVVLVHGSGPNDRDETIGPNRPFLDLAIGLAQRGIATLRYDKRTRVHGARLANEVKDFTLDDEIVDDAVAALKQAADRSDGAVFVVGHSEGAWLAPRIAAAATKQGVKIAGIVMLAAPLTPLVDLEAEQYEFLAGLPTPTATAAMVEDFKARRENLRRLIRERASGKVDAANDLPLPAGLPASLWLDISGYDPAAALLAQPLLPALLTFGERDYQVPIREKALWEARLGERARTTIATFAKLDHLLIDGEGPPGPAEYGHPGHVSQALIDRVAAWIERVAR